MILSPIPTMTTPTPNDFLSQVATFSAQYTPAWTGGYDLRALYGEAGIIPLENFLNYCVKELHLKKGVTTVAFSYLLGIGVELILAAFFHYNLQTAIITGIAIGIQSNLYHDASQPTQ